MVNVWGVSDTTQNLNQSKQVLTLKLALQKTLSQNPQLHQFNFKKDQLLAHRNFSELKPAYEFGMEVENFAGNGETKSFDSTELTVALSSAIELGDKQHSRVDVANAHLERFDLERQAQTLDVLADVTRAFVHVLSTQEELKLASDAVSLSESLYRTVEKRSQQGAVSDWEVMRAKAMLVNSQLQRDGIQQKLERQKVSLARFWGNTDVTFSKLDGDLYAFGKSLSFSELYDKVSVSPAMRVFASEIRLKKAEVRLAKSENQANLNWQFGVKRMQDSGDTAFTAGFSMPLFSESRNSSRVDVALAKRNSVAYQRTEHLMIIHDRLYTAYSQRQQFMNTYQKLKEKVIPILEKAHILSRKAYERGRLKYQDWIAAQQELLSAKKRLIKSASAALLNQAVIEQLTAEPLTQLSDADINDR